MGTISARTRKDGTIGYTARIQVRKGGKVVFTQTQTFDKLTTAKAWLARKEKEPAIPRKTLAEAIDWYLETSQGVLGKTKWRNLKTLTAFDIAQRGLLDLTPGDLVGFAKALGEGGRKPQTVLGYLSTLSTTLGDVRTARDLPLSRDLVKDALDVTKRLGLTAKSAKRTRRPTRAELTRLLDFMKTRRGFPMGEILIFATFSARRQEEITKLLWADLEPGRILVRDMKDPGRSTGNHIWCDLPPEAEAVIRRQPRTSERIFPVKTDTICTSFIRACKILGIEDLHFHDLRHEAASRLFEMGWSIPKVATVTGHRSWTSLQRYSHLRQEGDPLANWP